MKLSQLLKSISMRITTTAVLSTKKETAAIQPTLRTSCKLIPQSNRPTGMPTLLSFLGRRRIVQIVLIYKRRIDDHPET